MNEAVLLTREHGLAFIAIAVIPSHITSNAEQHALQNVRDRKEGYG